MAKKKQAAKKATKPRTQKKATKKKTTTGAVAAPSGVMVVNIIPRSLSRETNQDSEPSLTVNPSNPLQIVATAFTPDPVGGALAPIFASTDGGATWRLNSIVPSVAGSSATGDISLAFASAGGMLYGGILRSPSLNFETLRTPDFTAPTAMKIVGSRPDNDQPYTYAITNAGKDRVYIGNNDFQVSPKTATVDVSLNGAVSAPTFKKIRIEARNTAGQDGPQVRPIAHRDGTAYAAFYGWRSQSGSFPGNTLVVTSDVVVVRDDLGGSGANPFQNLKDADGLAGRLVIQGAQVPFRQRGTTATGQQRIGGTLSIAVDPRPNRSGTIYLAWGDKRANSDFVLHLCKSDDRGVTWSPSDLLTVTNATNAALAINGAGVVGLLYQQLVGVGAAARWKTHFRRSSNGVNWNDLILADTPASVPAKTFDPFLGDYTHLVAVDGAFYGVFSANNSPNMLNFPCGVTFQRNANFTTHTLLAVDNTTPVATSIDPFFFKVS
jgi:hypothetical protein